MTENTNPHTTAKTIAVDEQIVAPMRMIEELQRYMSFTQEDVERLVEVGPRLSPHFSELVKSFYTALTSNPRTQAVFDDESQIKRLENSLEHWLQELFCGTYDEAYYAKRMRIGQVHVKVGLAPHFVSGALTIIRDGLETFSHTQASEPGELHKHMASVNKMLDIELCLMHQSYWNQLFKEKLKLPQALAMGLAHEIRNPLNGINLNITLMERRLRAMEGGEQLSPMLDVMRQEVRRVGALTSEIMDFAKPIDLQLRWTESSHLLNMIETLHGPTLNASNIKLTTTSTGGPKLWCDQDRIMQVLTNLVNNAAEAIERDGHIDLEIHNTPSHTTLIVRDDGKGMDPNAKYRIFELFFTDKIQGTGLGLPIVHKIIESHQGTIDLTTKPGKGTTFNIFLPQRTST